MIISTCLSCKMTWKDRKMIVETWSFVSRLYSHFDGLTSSLQCKSFQLNVLTIRKIEVRSAIYSRFYLSSYHNCVEHTQLHWKKNTNLHIWWTKKQNFCPPRTWVFDFSTFLSRHLLHKGEERVKETTMAKHQRKTIKESLRNHDGKSDQSVTNQWYDCLNDEK